MPMITGLGHSQHRMQFGKGLFTSSDIVRGTVPTPSQQRRGISAAALDRQWFQLDRPTKQLWQNAANVLTWSDFGGDPRTPTGRQLYNRLNRSRHTYYLDDRIPSSPIVLPTVSVPPGAPVQMGEVYGFSITSSCMQISPDDPDFPTYVDPRGTLEYAWVQMATIQRPADMRSLNSTDNPGITSPTIGLYSEHHHCLPNTLTLPTVSPGTIFETYDLDYMLEHGWGFVDFTPTGQVPPPGPTLQIGYYTKPLVTNYIDNYNPYVGYASLTATPPVGANVAIELKWRESPRSYGQPTDRWRYLATLPADLHSIPLRSDIGEYEVGGNIMPPGTLLWPDFYDPGPGTSDWSFSAQSWQHSGIGGALLRFRYWPFDANGWPGSIREFVTTAGPEIVYTPLPDCPIPPLPP